jgi:hypothetical protein
MSEGAARGQTIRTETGPNRSSHKVNESEALAGRKMAGGPTDVGHSLTGAGEVNTYNNKGKGGK